MDTLYNTKREQIQQISIDHTRKVQNGRIGIVFYDMTPLSFEALSRSRGSSKDGKPTEEQILLGLLVGRDGYPLTYNIFNVSQYEEDKVIPIIDDFVKRFSLTDFVVVADDSFLSRNNISSLKKSGYKFIIGDSIKKETKAVSDWVMSLEKDPCELYETTINGDERIIVSYSEKQAVKDRNKRDKGIKRLRKVSLSGKISRNNVNKRGYNKFLVVENDDSISIDENKIAADAQWDGLKSYITNTNLQPEEVIEQYNGLSVVERAFKVTRGTLDVRPVFHFTERRIEAHICICFVAYKLYKEFERLLKILCIGLSVDKVLDIAKTISTVTISLQDGTCLSKTLLTRPEQRLLTPLFPSSI